MRSDRLGLRCFVSLAVCLLISRQNVRAQAPPPAVPEVPWEGFQAFKFLLLANGLTPVSSFEDLVRDHTTDPSASILISLGGDCSELPMGDNGLRTFLQSGGMALIATDRATGPNLEKLFGVRITGDLWRAQEPAEAYMGKPECPFLRITGGKGGPPVRNLNRVAVNVPSVIELTDRVLQRVHWRDEWASLPNMELPVAGTGVVSNEHPLFGVLGRVWGRDDDPGRYALILADHSIFINGMMLPQDRTHPGAPNPSNQNLEFATALIKWLKESNGRRTKILFLENGQVVTDFGNVNDWINSLDKLPTPRLKDLPAPPAALVNALITGLERENIFNKIVLDNVIWSRLVATLGASSAAVLAAYGVYRAFRARHHVEAESPLFAAALAKAAPPTTPTAQRHDAMVREGALWELTRDTVRHAFARLGFANDAAGTRPPRLAISGGWWARQAMTRKIARLWRLAYKDEPQRISSTQFSMIVKQVHEMENAVADGIVQISPAEDRV